MRRRRSVLTCRCGKLGYPSQEAALSKAARMQAHPHGQVGHRVLGVYRCPVSGVWHVGHRPRVLSREEEA